MKSRTNPAKAAQDEADSAALAELRTLQRGEQEPIVLRLLDKATRRDTLRLLLSFLRDNPFDSAHERLAMLYEWYSRNKGAADYGAYVRSDIVRALHPIARTEDVMLLVRALQTYEFPPPAFKEEAVLLRASALVTLADIDLEVTRFHAARLIVDPYADPMSGEPALSAATVLAALAETPLLYACVCDQRNVNRVELVAECLRGLTTLPPDLLPSIIAQLGDPPQPVLLLGAIELMLRHSEGVQQRGWLIEQISDAPIEHMRYLIYTAISVGDEAFMDAMVDALQGEKSAARREAASDALAFAAQRADVKALLKLYRNENR